MIEADLSMTNMALNPRQGGSDEHSVYAEFYMHPRLNQAKSREAGRQIFEDTPYVKIMIAGDKDSIVKRPVRERDKQRFPTKWQAFQNQEVQPMVGTPLAEWAGCNRSMVEEFKQFGIRTVEDLVNMPDSQASKFMGINMLRTKAKAFLKDASYAAPFEQLKRENDNLQAQITEMQDQLRRLNESADKADEAPAPKTRRRKRSGSIQDDQ